MKLFALLLTISLSLIACVPSSEKVEYIAIQPLGEMEAEVIDSISSVLSRTYPSQVCVLESKSLPKSAFIHVKSPRYRADSLLRYLNRIKPDSVKLILGLTAQDISTTKRDAKGNIKKPEYKYEDWGVFGLGYRPGSACVISTFRIKNKWRGLYLERIQKIATHEIGHNHGLKHCSSPDCVMQDAAETIATVDMAGMGLCTDCKNEIELP